MHGSGSFFLNNCVFFLIYCRDIDLWYWTLFQGNSKGMTRYSHQCKVQDMTYMQKMRFLVYEVSDRGTLCKSEDVISTRV